MASNVQVTQMDGSVSGDRAKANQQDEATNAGTRASATVTMTFRDILAGANIAITDCNKEPDSSSIDCIDGTSASGVRDTDCQRDPCELAAQDQQQSKPATSTSMPSREQLLSGIGQQFESTSSQSHQRRLRP